METSKCNLKKQEEQSVTRKERIIRFVDKYAAILGACFTIICFMIYDYKTNGNLGYMIAQATPDDTNDTTNTTTFDTTMKWIASWVTKLGGVLAFLGVVEVGQGFIQDNPSAKTMGWKFIIGGGIVAAAGAAYTTFM